MARLNRNVPERLCGAHIVIKEPHSYTIMSNNQVSYAVDTSTLSLFEWGSKE